MNTSLVPAPTQLTELIANAKSKKLAPIPALVYLHLNENKNYWKDLVPKV